MSGMRDIAKLSGVSLSTVSVVLNEGSNKFVSQENIDKVMSAVKELDYKLPPKKDTAQPTVAVVLPIISSSFFPSVLAGIESIADKNNYSLLYCDAGYSFEKEKRMVHMLKKHLLKGIIIDSLCKSENEEEYLNYLKEEFIDKKNLKIVCLERLLNRDDIYSIGVDDHCKAHIATQYLIDIGHTKIAHIAGPIFFASASKRFEGYKQALIDNNIQYNLNHIHEGDFTPLSGYTAMKHLLLRNDDFTAVFVSNDQMAIGAIKAIKEAGKKVPEDIAVVGFDNISHSSVIEPPLTTINVPRFRLGSLAAEIIMSGNVSNYTTKLDANLIIRKSSDVYAPNEWDLVGW